MSLPNFVNYEPFNVLRRKMRAENLGQFEFNLPERDAPSKAKPASAAGKTKAASKTRTASKARKAGRGKARVADNE